MNIISHLCYEGQIGDFPYQRLCVYSKLATCTFHSASVARCLSNVFNVFIQIWKPVHSIRQVLQGHLLLCIAAALAVVNNQINNWQTSRNAINTFIIILLYLPNNLA